MDVAGQRPRPAAVRLRRLRLQGAGPASGHRHRRTQRQHRRVAGRRHGHIRRLGAFRGQDIVAVDGRRAVGDVATPRLVRGRPRRRRGRGRSGRDRRPERRVRSHGSVRLHGSATSRGSTGVPRPVEVSPPVGRAAGRASCCGRAPCAAAYTYTRSRPAAGCRRPTSSGASRSAPGLGGSGGAGLECLGADRHHAQLGCGPL